MGLRGPPPTPKPILKLHGSWRGELNPDEPKPQRGTPPKPAWLGPEGSKLWDEIVPYLHLAGMLTVVDGQVLARYCDTWERWLAAAKFLRENGEMYPVKNKHGQIRCFMPFPQCASYRALGAMLVRMEQELGLSPSARTRVRALPEILDVGEEDAIDAIFSGRPIRPAG